MLLMVYVLILYPTTLPESLRRSSSPSMKSFGSPIYWIMASSNRNYFTSSFPKYIPLISFFFFFLPSNFRTILDSNNESRHPYLVLDLNGNISSFCHIHCDAGCRFTYIALIVLKYVPCKFDLLIYFCPESMLYIIKCFCSDNYIVFIFQCINALICLCWIIAESLGWIPLG